jgi:tetratricopeptide (TPR) repeat protein
VTDRNETSPSRKKSRPIDVGRLHSDVEWALGKGLGPRDLIPMLERLARHAEPGSASWAFAATELSSILVESDPWRAAALARAVLAHQETDRVFSLLGLALAKLGHYEAARTAYENALQRAPSCTSYAHNVGHLLDAGLDRPREGLPYLEQAYRARPFDAEIAASFAHALVRVGRAEEARAALEGAMGEIPGEVDALMARFMGSASVSG